MLNRYLSQQEILNLSGGKQRGEIVRLEVDWKGHRIPFTAKLLYNRQSQKYPAHQKGYLVFKDQSSGSRMDFDIALNTLELDLPVLGNTGMFFSCRSFPANIFSPTKAWVQSIHDKQAQNLYSKLYLLRLIGKSQVNERPTINKIIASHLNVAIPQEELHTNDVTTGLVMDLDVAACIDLIEILKP